LPPAKKDRGGRDLIGRGRREGDFNFLEWGERGGRKKGEPEGKRREKARLSPRSRGKRRERKGKGSSVPEKRGGRRKRFFFFPP